MRINPTIALTLFLLAMMFGAGGLSASWGLKLGKDALKDVTQPDVRPSNGTGDNTGNSGRGAPLKLLKEEEVIKRVEAQMDGKVPVEPEPKEQKPSPAPKAETPEKTEPKAEENKEEKDDRFPIAARDRDVTFEVRSVKKEENSLILDVSLKNESDRSIQFLYSFLNVTDDRGRVLSASTDGLPGDLPPDARVYTGTVSIPTSLLDDAKQVSMSLTDYPDRELQLDMSPIPIAP
ncbi:hypothetical protein JJD41_03435 [Oxynema sp. CENA135]|uniref:hypothetical protein n=1 Tax=Oxynema sp. CENA135 TaxID=984206 RepID=UPI00190DB1AB|nr:hypothetical protein [Oxynema sp. CENA135]MBK4728945.1 hypothetical protein [Oxynema sp. CENA135]